MSSFTGTAPAAARAVIYLGMDVHKKSITIAVLPDGAKTPTRLEKLANDLPKLKRWIERVARDGAIRACYEASGAGYVLHRALQEWGYACDVTDQELVEARAAVALMVRTKESLPFAVARVGRRHAQCRAD